MKLLLACALIGTPILIGSSTVVADQVISDDLIVGGSQCVGAGCEDGEVFDFDTIKISSDTPQIKFQDTSSTAAFPTQDWSIGVTDSASNVSIFFIEDPQANATVLQLEATASGGVALGAGAELVSNAVSVGAEGAERRVTHVADGIDPTDAVNLGQFNQYQSDMDAQLTALEMDLADLLDRVTDLMNRLEGL